MGSAKGKGEWCSICGQEVWLKLGTTWCHDCERETTQALPEPPATQEEIMALDTTLLPHALWEAKLAPKAVTMLPCMDGIVFYRSNQRWRPDKNWDDAAYYLNQYAASIWQDRDEWLLCCPSLKLRTKVFAEIPALICRLALCANLDKSVTTHQQS